MVQVRAAQVRATQNPDRVVEYGAWNRGDAGITERMDIGTSIFLIAVGAILKFAVTASVTGISLATVGTILMILGIVGLVISMVLLSQRRGGAVVTQERVVERDPYVDPRA